jgi:cyclic beta-1,2-glucan synthetase
VTAAIFPHEPEVIAAAPAVTGCPGLDPTQTWDDVGSLRGEMHTADQLAEHAVEVARAHGKPSSQGSPGPLRARFAAARTRIREAYRVLSRAARERREPTPAEEWLLDNSHVVEDQLREIQEDLPWAYLIQLPRIAAGAMRGHPRVYGLCLDYLRHTDGRVDLDTLSRYVLAYQSVGPLTIGELWAVPIMLRMGLVLCVGALAASEASARDRARGDAWAQRLIAEGRTVAEASALLAELERGGEPVTAALVVQLLRHLREHDAPLGAAGPWLRAQSARMHTTLEELTRRQHLRQAADQVSVGNAITSMRAIGAFDWNRFFEQTSAVEAVLRRDPSGAYAWMDDASRDRYRHAVEEVARRAPGDETRVAEAALALAEAARDAGGDPARAHVGFYLIDGGRVALEARVGSSPRIGARVRRAILAWPLTTYLGGLAAVTAGVYVAAASVGPWGLSAPVARALLALLLLPASEVAATLVSGAVVTLLPPRLLPKMALEQGVPVEDRTLVVVPALLDGPDTIRRLLDDLEVRALATPDANVSFALLTDFVDADVAERDDDAALLELTRAGVEGLNGRHHGDGEARFFLLHRRRQANAAEGCWMGWERKRGKLHELNRLLRGATDTSFTVVTAPPELLAAVRYVITLDADTELPRDAARRLVATISHPLNRPRLDPSGRRVVSGHGVLQPRVGALPSSSRRSRFARMLSGAPGIDPYTTAVSDVYQDLFGQGSFVGKGIYDVDAFEAALAGRVPENAMLSHDLFEGTFARSALVSDIELLDELPASYAVATSRQHRWTRGDWQLLPWIVRDVGAGALGRWKMLDNLRRSLLAPALVAFALAAWLAGAHAAAWASAVILAVFVLPAGIGLLLTLLRTPADRAFGGGVGGDLRDGGRQALVHGVFLLDRALVSLDAIGRALHRLVVSHRRLLEWQTMRQADQHARIAGSSVRLWFGAALAMGAGVLVAVVTPASLPFAVPLLLLWAAAPAFAAWTSRPTPVSDPLRGIDDADRAFLRELARKTWRFFETFVTDADHALPPDNYQEEPRGVIAHRTSPTNIGLYLLSVVAARDFGFLTLGQVAARLRATLTTMERMERREGHILNWYDTTTLRPLDPQYISTVDSGNLAGYLWTIRGACVELAERPVLDGASLQAARDALRLASIGAESAVAGLAALDALLVGAPDVARFQAGAEAARALRDSAWGRASGEEASYWLDRCAAGLTDALDEVRSLAPFLARLEEAPEGLTRAPHRARWLDLRTRLAAADSPAAIVAACSGATVACAALAADLATDQGATLFLEALQGDLTRAAAACAALTEALSDVGVRSVALADGMNFRFLYDRDRELFAIGYNVGNARLDTAHYDLLASEARLGSLVAIAKGDVPQKHWFRLGRPRAAVEGRRALLAWSGSMFEFLMPLLVTRDLPGTLLHETYGAVVRRQRAYGVERGVPWGISESAYNIMDLAMTYQYRAFGVPGLGLKAGLSDDLVVAPYATVLAALVRPDLALQNLRALSEDGVDGAYGYYEAVDYTPAHIPPGGRRVVVKTFMAHHQGMSLVALDNVLHGAPMPRRFHADPRVKATELLLEERVPARAPIVSARPAEMPASFHDDTERDVVEHVGLSESAIPRVHLLGQGELSTLVTATGEGFTTWRGMDVGRFREDPLLGSGALSVYVRDLTRARLWSAGYEPTRAEPDFYDVAFSIDKVQFNRRDGDVETVTELVVSPEHPAELRRVTLTNHGAGPRDLDITTCTEVVLAPRRADIAHRAFGGLFIETEVIPERGALIAHRRPRTREEPDVWLVQVLVPEGDAWGPLSFDTARASFIGREGTPAHPRALRPGAALAGAVGAVLDPVLALRRAVRLAPGAHARVTLATGLATSRAQCLTLIDTFTSAHTVPRTFELGWADARVELRYLGVTAAQSHRFQRLLSAVIFPRQRLRAPLERGALSGRGRGALWTHGISGDLPIVVVRIDDPDFSELLREVVLAHEFWRLNGVSVDLVVLNEEPSGYLQAQQEAVIALLRASPGERQIDQRGGVYLRPTGEMSDDDRATILSASRVVLCASRGSLARQLRRVHDEVVVARVPFRPLHPNAPPVEVKATRRPTLLLDNGVGGFGVDGREYVIAAAPGAHTPTPWCNVIANRAFGTLISERGASFTWARNSQRHRLTPWSNDPICDPSGEALYVRDDEVGAVWSPTPAPAGDGARYTVSHGQGYTRFEHTRGELVVTLTVFVSPVDAVKVSRLAIENRGSKPRRLSLFGVVEWVLGESRETSRLTVVTEWDPVARAVLATNLLASTPERAAFFAVTGDASCTGDREEFFGAVGSRERPAATRAVALSGRVGAGLDPCAALQVAARVEPGQRVVVSFVLGEADGVAHARSLCATYLNAAAIERCFLEATGAWDQTLAAVQVKTPVPALDLLVNRWLVYQVMSCRLWGRSGFYQSGGAYGFRDQLQDVLALVHARPELTREHLLRAAARQFLEGDVQHWWHPGTGDGVRTRCADDLLWLPFAVAAYVRSTGDAGVLDEMVPFLHERALTPEETDLFTTPNVADASATLYDHCARALDAGATSGPNGLPTMRGGDWNDGMNLVGHDGRGESVWLAWFLARTAKDFAPIAEARGDVTRVGWCAAQVERLRAAVDERAWDGAWYRRAYFDDGTPLGSAANEECRIDAIAQSWSVIAGIGDPARAAQALRESEARLVRDDGALMALLWPPFNGAGNNPGYIQAYYPGVRENGGQYTHGVLWTVQALALSGHGERAWRLLSLMNPAQRSDTPQAVARYHVEPYVVAADVYAASGHQGRGGWSWYTGSASLMYRIVIEDLLGLRRRGATLAIDPCVPPGFPGFEVTWRDGEGHLHITVENPDHVERGVRSIAVDGKRIEGQVVALTGAPGVREVRVVLGVVVSG